MSTTKPTAPALRAARAIAFEKEVDLTAAIIDSETGLPDLLEFVADWRGSFAGTLAGSADEVARQFVHEADALLARANANPR